MRTLLAILVALLLALTPLALADDEDEDKKDKGRGDDERNRGKHKMDLDVGRERASIKLSKEDANGEHAIRIDFDADGARLRVQHESENETSESSQKLEARFHTLAEFVDTDGDGIYDAGEPIASAYRLGKRRGDGIAENGSADWGPITDTAATSAGGVAGRKLSSTASLGGNATFGLDMYVYGDLTTVGNTTLLPTEAKVDIRIANYPYMRNDSRLAVLVTLKSSQEFESERGDDDEQGLKVHADANGTKLDFRFTWLETATVDGIDLPVGTSVIEDKAEEDDEESSRKSLVAFSYARGTNILHDPTIGASYGTASADANPVPGPGLIALVAGVAVLAVALRRRS